MLQISYCVVLDLTSDAAIIDDLGLDSSTRAVLATIGKLLASRAKGISRFVALKANSL